MGPPPGTIAAGIAAYVRRVSPEDLSSRHRSFVKLCLLDVVGCMLAGTASAAGQIAVDFAHGTGGRAEAGIVRGRAVAVERAAFANTVLGNANDFEPVGPEGHVAAVCVPSALAVAQWLGASGAQLLVAIAAGIEVSGRIGASFRRPSSVAAKGLPAVRGTAHAIFASTIPAAKLLGLDDDQIRNAVGIAAYSAPLPTLRKTFESPVPAMTKYDHLALQAQCGIDAARLARLGFTGDRAAFEGDYGMWRFSGALDCDWDFLGAELGGEWVVDATFFKPFPVVLYLLPSIEAVSRAMAQGGLSAADIERIDVEAEGLHATPGSVGDPLARWVNVPLNIAHAIRQTRPFADWMNAEPSAAVLELMQRIAIRTRPAARGGYWEGRSGAEATIVAHGREHRAETTHIPRMTPESIVEKFRENATPVVGRARAQEILDLIESLEDLASVAPLASALA